MSNFKVLAVASVARSIALQAPSQWHCLRRLGCEITFVAGDDGYLSRVRELGETVETYSGRIPSMSASLRDLSLLRTLLQQDWDLVQLQTPIASSLARLVLPRARAYPVLYVVHGFHFHPDGQRLSNGLAWSAERLLRRRVDQLAVVSEWDAHAAGRLGYRPERVVRLPGAGVDLSRFSFEAERPGTGALLFVGDLNENKNPLFALEILRHLVSAFPLARLTVVGDGSLGSELHRIAHRWGLVERVEHIPRTDEVAQLMADRKSVV